MDKKDKAAALIAASLPDDRAALLKLAHATVAKYNESILSFNDDAVTEANSTYEAIIWKINGGTFSSCLDSSNEDAGGIIVNDHCAAEPGIIPLWGQQGEFLIEVDGIRAVVELTDSFTDTLWPHFAFRAVDATRDFISETGFLSHFCQPQGGKHVSQLATEIFKDILKKNRRPLAKHYREQSNLKSFPWLRTAADDKAFKTHEEAEGQLAFGF